MTESTTPTKRGRQTVKRTPAGKVETQIVEPKQSAEKPKALPKFPTSTLGLTAEKATAKILELAKQGESWSAIGKAVGLNWQFCWGVVKDAGLMLERDNAVAQRKAAAKAAAKSAKTEDAGAASDES